MIYEHNYEFAFYHYRTEYMVTGKKNWGRYTLTGCYTNGDYFRFYCSNKDSVEYRLNQLRNATEVEPDSIAMQNEIGQLMWNSETGFNDGLIHPKYMDSMECMKTSFWSNVSGF